MQTESGGKGERFFNAPPLPHTTKAPTPLLFKFLRLMEIKPVWCFLQTPCGLSDQIKELVYLSVRFGA